MDVGETTRVLEAITLRARGAMSLKQSELLLDVLRDFAREGKIAEISEACELYFMAIPQEARRFVADRLSNIIFNHYLPTVEGFDFRVCVRWREASSGWVESIRDNASSPRLPWIVEGTVASIREYGRAG